MKKWLVILSCFYLLSGKTALSEEKKTDAKTDKADDISREERDERRSGIAKLIKKLQDDEGNPVPVGILAPLDYTTLNFSDVTLDNMYGTVLKYGKFDLKTIPYSPGSLSLEEFRKIMVRNQLTVAMLAVLKPTNFDIFLFDKRTPYRIYLHSETLPEKLQFQLTKEVVEEYVKVIVRRVLFAYMQDKYFDLPREEAAPFLTAEIPKWVANPYSFRLANKEILSVFNASVSVGAAISQSPRGLWTSNLVNIDLGVRIYTPIYLHVGADLFAYTSMFVGLKYWMKTRTHPYQYAFGIAMSSMINKHTLNWDQTYGLGSGGDFVAVSAAVIFPIVDIHFKLEGKMYMAMGGEASGSTVFAFLPGIFYYF